MRRRILKVYPENVHDMNSHPRGSGNYLEVKELDKQVSCLREGHAI